MTQAERHLFPVCGHRAHLPDELAAQALTFAAPGAAEPDDVQDQLRCTLQAHVTGAHSSFVMELDGRTSGAVWTHWARGGVPEALVVKQDCPVSGPEPACEPCCEYVDHPGAHTWELDYSWRNTPLVTAPKLRELLV
ncbi:hypothetical protein [Streptomyces sp. CA-111067]|uniref:hypothetical protein n=1 Tax=Streptomyces sp. CA-111067 TaxID=3240046 RepID=UPI003D97DADC